MERERKRIFLESLKVEGDVCNYKMKICDLHH